MICASSLYEGHVNSFPLCNESYEVLDPYSDGWPSPTKPEVSEAPLCDCGWDVTTPAPVSAAIGAAVSVLFSLGKSSYKYNKSQLLVCIF